jgi:hypothetical protein
MRKSFMTGENYFHLPLSGPGLRNKMLLKNRATKKAGFKPAFSVTCRLYQ